MQDDLKKKYTTVMHLYMRKHISNEKVCGRLILKVVEKFRLPYFMITSIF